MVGSSVVSSSVVSPALPYVASLLLSAAVVVASVIPLGAARSQANFQISDLRAPRAMFDRLPPWGQRASWAHQNSFEAFGLHAPAALLCVALAVASPTAALAAWLHPALRLAYLGAYIGNVPALRGLCWAAGLVCTGVLYAEGLRAVLGG